jgi:sigma-B regulation protein RsbU (phosphoserine phosphatase)
VQRSDARPTTESKPKPPTFGPFLAALYSLLVGLIGLGVLGYQIVTSQERLAWFPILIFTGLSLVIQRSSFHFGTPVVHSLAGVIELSAVLALGPTAGSMVAGASGLIYLESNALYHQRLTRRYLIETPLFNAGLKASIALLGGALFQALGGPLPLRRESLIGAQQFDGEVILAICAVSVLWFVLDQLGWGFLGYLEGGLERLRIFFHDAIPQALYVALLPLPFSLVVALVYTYLSWPAFALVALFIVAVAVLQSGMAQRWADARNELVQRVAELSTIEQIGRTIAEAQLDVDELCRLMYGFASQVADATIFHLGLFDGDTYTLKLWIRQGEPVPQQTFQMTPGVGLVNWMRESKQPILVRDFAKEIDSLPAQPVYVSDNPPRSALYVPLIASETVIGTMSIQSFRRNAYGDGDLRVLSAMANQAAIAIQKAQLYAQERKRVRQLETISQVTSQVAAILELDELFHRVVHLVRENFGYYYVVIYTVDRERQSVTFQASAQAWERKVAIGVEWGQGLIGWVAAHGQAVLVNDVGSDTRYRSVEALEETHSELAVPLLLEGELVGVLDVQSDQRNAFGPDDLFILETLGAQVALAIHEARLYEAEQQQAWLSTAMLQVAEAASRLSDMDDVVATIVRLVPLLAGVDRCAILLWDPDTETFVPAQTHGLAPKLRETFAQMRFPSGAVPALDLIRLDNNPLLVNAARDGLLIPRDLAETFSLQEMAVLPLLARGEFLGAMLVDYAGQAHSFGERMINMLTGIANQAATVIQSARLVQAQQEEAYVSMALLQVADTVNRSADLQETLAAVVRITPMLVGVEACAILLWDGDASAFLPVQQYGLKGELEPAFWQLRLTKNDPPMYRLLAGEPFVRLEGLDGNARPARAEGSPSAAASKPSLLMLPLVTKGEVVGGMLVEHSASVQHFRRWTNILTGIAGQAAIAVENDRLLQEAAEQERMKQELEVARRIQISFLPECCPHIPGWELASLWRSARQVGGDFYDFIPLPPSAEGPLPAEDRLGLAIADVADKGVPAALFMALCRTLVRTVAIDGRSPSAAIGRANDLILADARSALFVTLFYTILPPHSGAIAYVNAGHMPPLLVRSADGRVEELWTHGMAVGVLPHMEVEERMAHLDPGDLLVLYTDGVTEASNAEGEMFGRERLKEVASAHRRQSAEELVQTIDDITTAFVGNAPQFDDFTLVVARRRPA